MAITDELKTAIREVVEAECRKDENGSFYTEIYVDYRDELSKKTILKICGSEQPRETFDEWMMETYQDCESDHEQELLEKVLDDAMIAAVLENGTIAEEDITDFVRDIHYVKLPYDHYLKADLCVNILLNTGDRNTDFTINQPFASWDGQHDAIIDENSAILWLARQQGYRKSALTLALKHRKCGDSKFLSSMLQEVENCSTGMNAVAFLVKMTLTEWFTLDDAIKKAKNRNKKGRDYITLDKSTTCGLYDPWGGAGSVLEIKLDRDVRLPIRFIDSALPDGGRGYSIDEIYGLCTSEWSDNAIKIHEQKKVA